MLRSENGAFEVVTHWVATSNYHFHLFNNPFSVNFCRTFEITSSNKHYTLEIFMIGRAFHAAVIVFCMIACSFCLYSQRYSIQNRRTSNMKHILTQPFFVNILPFSPGNEKKVADCAKDYAAKTGNKIVLYMLIMDVEYPAEKKIAHAVESYRKLKKELADSDLQLGVLIQSILGHVPRGHKKFEPWTRTRDIDGKNVRYCILDPRMQDYVFKMTKAIAAENPCFIMTDDDCRSFSPKAECFCDLHTAEFNKRMKTSYTPKEYIALVKKSKPGDAVFNTFRKLQEEQVVLTLKTVRKAIDSVNPAIPTGNCLSGWEQPFGHEIAKSINGKGLPKIMRIGNALYLEFDPKRDFPYIAAKTMAMRQYYPEVDFLLDESDNYPHSLFGRSSRNFHAKITSSLFFGLAGAKLWLVNMFKGDVPMAQKYTDILAKNRLVYPELVKLAKESKQSGVIIPSYSKPHSWHPTATGELMKEDDNWGEILFAMYGIPWKMSVDRKEKGIYAIAGAKAVDRLTDAEIRELLGKKLLLDGVAATAFCKRGFSEYLGVMAEKKSYRGGMILDKQTGKRYWADGHPERPFLTVKDATVLAEFQYKTNSADPDYKVSGPAVTLYKNKLGGRVCVTAYCVKKYQVQTNTDPFKNYVVSLLDYLNGEPLPYLVKDYQNVSVFSRTQKTGEEVLAVYALSFDRLDPINIRCARKPETVEYLATDGTWKKADHTFADGTLTIRHGLEFFECIFLKIK